jgi:hypothetical protein
MRSVTTNSYTTDGSSLDETIPAVPALAAQPRPESDPNFDRDIHAWPEKIGAWKKAATAASAVDARIVGQVRRFQVARHTWSGIYSCIAAAAAQLSSVAGLQARIAVESDMMNNRPVAGLHLSGDALLLVTICPAKVATSCPRRFAAARRYLLRHGAASVVIVRSDAVTPATFEAFWRGP